MRNRLRSSMFALAVLVAFTAPTIAQDLSEDTARFGRMWEQFEARCTLAVNDPIAYAKTLPTRDPSSDIISRAEDGTHIRVRHVVDGFAEEFWFADVGPYRRIECNYFMHDLGFTEAPNVQNARWNEAILAYAASRPDLNFLGGSIVLKDAIFNSMPSGMTSFHYNIYPDILPNSRSQAVFVDTLPSSFIATQNLRGEASMLDAIFTAGPLPVSPTSELNGDTSDDSDFARAVQICLDHIVDKEPMETFRAAGFEVTAQDEGTFNIEAPGVSGFLAPLLATEWCWLESDSLKKTDVAELVFALARQAFPDGVDAPAARGELANGCPSISLAYSATRLSLLELRNAGFFNGCDEDGPGGVLFR